MEALNLTAILERVPVNLKVKKGAKIVTEKCELVELTGGERSEYLQGTLTKLNKDGKTVKEANRKLWESSLITLCLVHENGEYFSIEEIEALPPETKKALFEGSKEIAGINKLAEEIAEKK